MLMIIQISYSEEINILPEEPPELFLDMSDKEKWGVVLYYFSQYKITDERLQKLALIQKEQSKDTNKIIEESKKNTRENDQVIRDNVKELNRLSPVHNLILFSGSPNVNEYQDQYYFGFSVGIDYCYMFNKFLLFRPLIMCGVSIELLSGSNFVQPYTYTFQGAAFRVGTGFAF